MTSYQRASWSLCCEKPELGTRDNSCNNLTPLSQTKKFSPVKLRINIMYRYFILTPKEQILYTCFSVPQKPYKKPARKPALVSTFNWRKSHKIFTYVSVPSSEQQIGGVAIVKLLLLEGLLNNTLVVPHALQFIHSYINIVPSSPVSSHPLQSPPKNSCARE